MFYKTIIQGRLSFNNEKSFDKVMKMFEYRKETYYKSDVLLKEEEIFDAENLNLDVPRFVGNVTDKSFRNTVSLLEYCAQFAVAGEINAWMIEEGKVQAHKNIQPESDKAIVMAFKKGDQLFQEQDKNEDAREAFTKTLEKYNAHAQAYERRGWVNLRLNHYSDALYDFNKAISIDDTIAYAYYGKAFIARAEGNLEQAIENFELTLKKSVALETLYWKARLKKAECHIELGQWEKAEFDLKFYTKRKFAADNSNNFKKAYSFVLYASVLHEQGKNTEALEEVKKAMETPEAQRKKSYSLSDALYTQGMIRKSMGKRDFKKILKNAAAEGSKEAEEVLANL